ncbi:IS3 family transposase [Streptomyces sp. NPDC018972]|uniref:IS3 family transposase n=1 Tax=Streptomyces sp. NPDC018972 TaxID=3365060 RepID=UPI0037966323
MVAVWARRSGRCRSFVQTGLPRRWRTGPELSTALFEYLEIFHNRQRRHSALEVLTPVEYELRAAPVA